VKRVAAIDCGTNSIRLLVTDLDPVTGEVVELDRRMEIVRLGEGVDATGRLADAALRRTFDACGRYAEVIERFGVAGLRFVATSATRDAANRADFVDGVRRLLGVEPEVISGAEEAALSYAGATRELTPEHAGYLPPALVVDIGGGSTEFVLGEAGDGAVRDAFSVDIGCVRLTERHLAGHGPADVPGADSVAAMRADADAAVTRVASHVALDEARTLVGLAGSVTTVAAIALDLPAYDRTRIHHARIPAAEVRRITDQLLAMSADQRRALPVMHPGRADVIAAGALVLTAIVERLGLPEVLVSEHDILDGIAWSLVDQPG
jgi:exopolyphosphatase/guanosine-5'-triphosphate,3'-diphosphate pyrophosphatase